LGRKGRRPEPAQQGGERKTGARGQAPSLLKDKRWVLVALLIILALGGTLRGLYLAEFSHTPDFKIPFADADFHNYWARALAFGNWSPPFYEVDPHIREIPYFRPPGYAYFLAAVYKLTGPSYFGPRVVQMALGLLNAFLAFLLARRYFGNLAGLVLAGIMATFWPFIYTEADFEEPVVSVFLLLVFAHVLTRWAARDRRTWTALGAGALVGLVGLMRPNALLLVLPALWWTWWVHKRRGEQGRFAKTAAALVAGTVLLVSPVTIRNYVVAHDFVPISSNGGINLYVGNREGADGLVKITLPGIGTLDTCFDHLSIVSSVERNVGHRMKHSEVSNYFSGLAFDWIRRNPGEFVKLLWHKALLFWGPVEVGGNKIAGPERAKSAVLSKDPVGFGVPMGFAIVGVALFWWERRRAAAAARAASDAPRRPRRDETFEFGVLALALVVTWYASYAPFANLYRYRAPILPFVFLFAAIAVDRLVALARARDLRHLVPWGAALAASLVVSNTNLARYEPNVAQWHYQNGIVMYRLGRLDQAIAEYRKALDINPDYVTVMVDLGAALGTQGKIKEAMPYLVRAARELPEKYEAQYNAAMALEMTGDYENARGFYEAALRVRPGEPSGVAGLARVEKTLGAGGHAPSP
jgi:4-amino-4-deoxy-L-arabinose transferase-like glycosyltransferase